MKKFLLISAMLLFTLGANANESLLSNCNKSYPVNADNLYMLTLSALNSSGQFDVLEMQSKSGYILFRTLNKNYIITISKESESSSGIKILPANSDFSSGTLIQKTIFDTIDANISNIPKKVL